MKFSNRKKPDDPRITAPMVLVNWIMHRRRKSDTEISEMLEHKHRSSVNRFSCFRAQDEHGKWNNSTDPIEMNPECFLWDWQSDACEYLNKRLEKVYQTANRAEIQSIIKAISGSDGSITEAEAALWACDVKSRRRVSKRRV